LDLTGNLFKKMPTPQGGRGKISDGGSIWDPSHGGGGGVAGPGAYIEVINHLVMWVNLYNIYI